MINKEFVKQYFINSDNKIIAARCVKSYLIKHNLYNDLINYYDDSNSINETIYRIVHDIDKKPICKICGKPVKFSNGEFPTYCCPKCRNNDPEVIAKNKAGVSKSLKEVYQKRGNEIKNKRQHTLKERYGIDTNTPFGIVKFQNKAKQTIQEKYGVNNILKLPEYRHDDIKNKRKSILLQKSYGYDIEYITDEDGETKILVKNGCKIHGDIIVSLSVFNNRTKPERKNDTILCTECNPLDKEETTIELIIKNILNDLNIIYIQHDRNQLHPYELDFYLPDYNIGIECNGVFWHSGKESAKKHLLKYNMCKEKGIKLITFWEDEIRDKRDIIKAYLKSILNKNIKIYARNCIIKEIDSKTSKNFIDSYHLQGNINASVKLGLYYNNELVEVMTFGKLRKCLGTNNENNVYELYRLCSKSGITIIGGASKLLKYFIDNYHPNKIISYCSKDISDGNVYEKIGMIFDKDCGQGYFYINKHTGERKSRFALRKDVVNDNSGRTETEINNENGWLKCYDTGCKKYILTIN